MATPPLPASPCVRCRLTYNVGTNGEGGNRLYLSYSGSAPSGADCATLASGVADAWEAHMTNTTPVNYSLGEVDVLDLASDTGKSGQWSGTHGGGRSGNYLPDSVATNIEFGIAERYRGGKPRMYIPPGVQSDLATQSGWSSDFMDTVQTSVEGFFTAIEALSVGSMGTLAHVVLSYYHGVNTATPPWRGPGYKYPPKYRDSALVYPVTGYFPKEIVGSQRRRRTSTTP